MKILKLIIMVAFPYILNAQTLFTSHGVTQIQLNDTAFVTVKAVDMGGFHNYYSYKDKTLVADDSTGDLFLYQRKHWLVVMHHQQYLIGTR